MPFTSTIGRTAKMIVRHRRLCVCTSTFLFFFFFAREYNAFNVLSPPRRKTLHEPTRLVKCSSLNRRRPRRVLRTFVVRAYLFLSHDGTFVTFSLDTTIVSPASRVKGGHLLQVLPPLFLLLVSLVSQICFLLTTNDRPRARERLFSWFCN